jgi:hypothetical protein
MSINARQGDRVIHLAADIWIVGRDDTGLIVIDADGRPWYVTDCCRASAKGMDDYIGCRNCYHEVSPSLGGIPDIAWFAPHRRAKHLEFLDWEREMVRKSLGR